VLNDMLLQHGIGASSNIKSIQRGEVSFSSTSGTVTISEVDLSKSIIIASTSGGGDGSPASSFVKTRFVSSTSINFTLGRSSTYKVAWQVIEFSNVKSLQRGLTNVTTDTDVTITDVDMSKSILFTDFSTTYTGADLYNILYKAKLTS